MVDKVGKSHSAYCTHKLQNLGPAQYHSGRHDEGQGLGPELFPGCSQDWGGTERKEFKVEGRGVHNEGGSRELCQHSGGKEKQKLTSIMREHGK